MSSPLSPDVSIVSATYNDALELQKTILSIKSLKTNLNIQHVIVDGKSKDNTLEIINSHRELQYQPLLLSESDEGVYDAINKGVELAEGIYILVMNAGDVFHNDFVLDEAFDYALKNEQPYIIGKVVYLSANGSYIEERFDRKTLKYIECSHQSFLYKNSLHKSIGKYDLRYKSAADYDFFSRVNITYPLNHNSRINMLFTIRDKTGDNLSDHISHSIEMLKIDILSKKIKFTFSKRLRSIIGKFIKNFSGRI